MHGMRIVRMNKYRITIAKHDGRVGAKKKRGPQLHITYYS